MQDYYQGIKMRSDVYTGLTQIMVIPEVNSVLVGNDPLGLRITSTKLYDFAGQEIYDQSDGKFKAEMFEFNKMVCIYQINQDICKEEDTQSIVYFKLNQGERSVVFVPIFVCPGYTLAIFDEEIDLRVCLIIEHAKACGFNRDWRKINFNDRGVVIQ